MREKDSPMGKLKSWNTAAPSCQHEIKKTKELTSW